MGVALLAQRQQAGGFSALWYDDPMERMETEVILRDLAEAAADALRANPHAVEALAHETQRRIEHHGYHPAYCALIAACRAGAPTVAQLLTSESAEGDLVRSVAPLRTLVSREQRHDIIAQRSAEHFAFD